MEIDELIAYCRMLLQFRSVERQVLLPEVDQNENDSEHSYMLAMTAWYIASTARLDLDIDLVLKYALAHDVVEVYAGDTYIYDNKKLADKSAREEAALRALRRNYPDFEELHKAIAGYEKKADPESRFIYALDKLIPVIVIYIAKGRSWQKHNVSLKMLEDHKDDKVRTSAIVADLWKQLKSKLAEQPDLFPTGKSTVKL